MEMGALIGITMVFSLALSLGINIRQKITNKKLQQINIDQSATYIKQLQLYKGNTVHIGNIINNYPQIPAEAKKEMQDLTASTTTSIDVDIKSLRDMLSKSPKEIIHVIDLNKDTREQLRKQMT